VNAATAGTTHPASTESQQTVPAKKKPTITISMFAFTTPKSVKAGATIKIVNKDSVAHTVTSDTDGIFDVPAPAKMTVKFKAPTTPGTYTFHCSIHPSMHGTLIVK
jgi:plastocyanin